MSTSASKVEYYCDNIEVVHKINTLAANSNNCNERYKTTDHDAVLKLREYLPPSVTTFHVKEHQDQRKQTQNLTTIETLNIKDDNQTRCNANVPLEQYIMNTPIAIYVQGTYIPNNYIFIIRYFADKWMPNISSCINTNEINIHSPILNWNYTPNKLKRNHTPERRRQ